MEKGLYLLPHNNHIHQKRLFQNKPHYNQYQNLLNDCLILQNIHYNHLKMHCPHTHHYSHKNYRSSLDNHHNYFLTSLSLDVHRNNEFLRDLDYPHPHLHSKGLEEQYSTRNLNQHSQN